MLLWEFYISIVKNIWDIITSTGILLLLGALLLNFVNIFLYSIRLKIVLKELGEKISVWDSLKITSSALFVNNITPMSKSGGEIIKIVWLKRRNKISVKKATISVIYDRLTEVFPIIVLAVISLFYMVNEMNLVLMLFVTFLLFIWFYWEDFIKYIAKLVDIEITKDEVEQINSLRKRVKFNLVVISISMIIWFFEVLRLFFIVEAFDIHLSFGVLSAITLGNLSLGLISFTPGGLGIVDGGLVGLFKYFGLNLKQAIIVTFIERFISYGVNSVIGFLVMSFAGGFELWKRLRSR